MSQAIGASPDASPPEWRAPYSSSWVDGLIAWAEALPGPTWLFYAGVLAGTAFLSHIVFWLDGSLEPGTFDPIRLADAVYVVYPLSLYHYLSLVAGRSLQSFRPLLTASVPEMRSFEYRLTNLPRRLGWLALLLGSALAIVSIQIDPASVGAEAATTGLPLIYGSVALSFTISMILALILQTFRQMRLVDELLRRATAIDLFELAPAHAFASLTATAGIGLILLIIFNGLIERSSLTEVNLAFVIVMGVLAVAVFSLPLLEMRNRLRDEKARQLSAVNMRIRQTLARLHDEVDANRHGNFGELKDAVGALIDERNLLQGISTWPWDAGTLRGFVTSLLLPLFLWLVTTLLGRLL